MFRIDERFEVSIPVSRARNPISRTNWEGVGVEPDVRVAAAEALQTAHVIALEKRLQAATDSAERAAIEEAIRAARRTLPT